MDSKVLEDMLQHEDAKPTDLPLSLLKHITKGFSDDLKIGAGGFAVVYKGLLTNNGTIAVKKLGADSKDTDGLQYNKEVDCLMRVKHKNIIRFLGYCADTQRKMLEHEGMRVMADVSERLLCFEYLPNGSLDRFMEDMPLALDWRKRFKIIKGICEGLHYLHDQNILHLDLKPGNILLDDNMVPKISDFGLSRCFDGNQSRAITSNAFGTLGYMAPELLENGKVKITKKSDIYSLGAIIAYMLTQRKERYSIAMALETWKNEFETISFSSKDLLLDQVRVCCDIHMKCVDFDPDKRPDIHWIIEKLCQVAEEFSQEFLQIFPVGLRFHFEPNKEISCPVNLINKTDNVVYFSIIPSNPERYAGAERFKGVVAPRSTQAVCVTMVKQQYQPPKMDLFRILVSTSESTEKGEVVWEESLMAFISDPIAATQAIKQEVIYNDDAFGQVEAMDVHPTEPWVLTGHSQGYICIWKMEVQKNAYSFRNARPPNGIEKVFIKNAASGNFRSVKFIPRTQCVVAGDSFGFMRVYTYIDNQLVEVTSDKAHQGPVRSLAVHPTHHFMLSSSVNQFKQLVWNDNEGWVPKCEWSCGARQMAFNPKSTETLAVVLDSAESETNKSIAILNTTNEDEDYPSTNASQCTCVAYSLHGNDDTRYIAIGHNDGDTEILDEQSNKYLHALKVANSGGVAAIACHPTFPLLVTGTYDGNVYLWNCATYRLTQALSFGHGKVIGFGFINMRGLKRLVIGFSNTIEAVELDWPTLAREQ